jgi:thymidylate synthase (FAD)
MNTAKIIGITQPLIMKEDGSRQLTPEELIAYAARVSNPSNQMNTETSDRLLRYCFRNKHFSIFEMVNVVMQIDTTRDIARQILRHRSFSFQEFSQRYADPTGDLGFVTREARLQDPKNRQNSVEIEDDPFLEAEWDARQKYLIDKTSEIYEWAIKNGIAKEQARSVLPEGMTRSRLYMNGTLRSWLTYLEVRCDKSTQKEHRQVAIDAANELKIHFLSLSEMIDDYMK